ncbi:MAG: ABC transporter ATP-binding protein [Acidobacteriota bacterium]
MAVPVDPHEEAEVEPSVDFGLLRRLLGFVRPYAGMASLAVALIIVSSLLQLIGPLTTAVALDLFVRPLDDQTAQAGISRFVAGWLDAGGHEVDPITGVVALAVFWALATAFAFVVLYAQSYVMQLMGQRIMFDLRRDVFDHLQRLPVRYFDRRPVGRLVTRATTDIESLNEVFTAGLVSIFGDIVLLGGIVTVLFLLDWRLAVVSFAILPLLFLLTLWFKGRARRSYREVRVKIARINAFLQEHIGGMSVVQLFAAERRALREFDQVNDEHRAANVRAIVYYAIYFPAIELITAIGLALIVWYGGGQILRGTLSIGALVAFLQYAQRFYQPLADLSEKYNILQAAMASSERIFELLDAEPEIVSPPDAYRPDRVEGRVELDSVRFAYIPGEPVLHDLSLRIEPGETVAVVGHTGAGKSTLANLMLRFYDIDDGAVRIDGIDVRQWDLERLRRSMAMVLQDVFLFAGDLAYNIRLGHNEISDQRLRRAAAEVQALELIESLPQGFSTEVQERGAGLSTGQKQLIAFARALAFDPEILILDEATASVDSETEMRIQQALERLLANRTSLVIAHRLSTIQRADRIVVLHKGAVREEGTHQELLALGGVYHKLFELQFRQETAAAS